MGTTTLIVTSSASPILISHVEICTNLDTNANSHKQVDTMETLRLNQNHMHALNDDNKFPRGLISKCNKFNLTSDENNKQ